MGVHVDHYYMQNEFCLYETLQCDLLQLDYNLYLFFATRQERFGTVISSYYRDTHVESSYWILTVSETNIEI